MAALATFSTEVARRGRLVFSIEVAQLVLPDRITIQTQGGPKGMTFKKLKIQTKV